MTTTANALKVRQNRVRDLALRWGFQVSKSRRRDPLAPDFDLWTIRSGDGSRIITQVHGMDAAEAELRALAAAHAQA